MRSPAQAGHRLVPVVVAIVVASALLGGGVGAVSDQADTLAAQQDIEERSTTWQIDVHETGDARWTVQLRFALDTQDRRDAFERLASEFEAGSLSLLSVEPFEQAAAAAENATGRPMAIDEVARNAVVRNATGVLELSFTWRAFAVTKADRIEVGDAFHTPDGTWLEGLEAGNVLVVTFPSTYNPVTVDPPLQLRNGSVHVAGPVDFPPGEPSVAFAQTRTTPTPTPTTAGPVTSPGNGTDTPPVGGDGFLPGLVLLVLIGLATLAFLWWRRRDDLPEWVPAEGSAGDVGDGPSETDPVESPDDEEATTVAASQGGASESGDEPLLSDEERILRLLRENEGRMKQAKIVEETDWSNAKVSQLLSEMAEDGEVEKLRIGRENLISLPDETPDGVE